MQKVDFLMTRVYVVFPFFFLAKQIYLLAKQSAKKKKKTGPDKSIFFFKKSYKLHFDEKSKI